MSQRLDRPFLPRKGWEWVLSFENVSRNSLSLPFLPYPVRVPVLGGASSPFATFRPGVFLCRKGLNPSSFMSLFTFL